MILSIFLVLGTLFILSRPFPEPESYVKYLALEKDVVEKGAKEE